MLLIFTVNIHGLARQKRYYNYLHFSKCFDESGNKPNKIWVDKGSEFYNQSMKSWLQDNDIMLWRCIQHITIGSLLLLKDLLESNKN